MGYTVTPWAVTLKGVALLPTALVTGHRIIDAQHERTLQSITEFRAAIVREALTPQQLRIFLGEIHDYAVNHFRDEEAAMRQLHYPAYALHRAIHLDFWIKLVGMMERCEENDFGPACGDLIYAEIGAWVKDHIYGEDRIFAAWVQTLHGTPPRIV